MWCARSKAALHNFFADTLLKDSLQKIRKQEKDMTADISADKPTVKLIRNEKKNFPDAWRISVAQILGAVKYQSLRSAFSPSAEIENIISNDGMKF